MLSYAIWPGTSAFTLYMVKSCQRYWNIILTLTYAYMNTYKFKECGLYKYLPKHVNEGLLVVAIKAQVIPVTIIILQPAVIQL